MIPKLLKIKGLYSYKDQEECIIDFEKLKEARLFGIFGATGSGKSSILEAILFALYGKTVRLGSDAKGEFMNVDSQSLSIDFEFRNGDMTYRRVVEAKRKEKDNTVKFEKVRTFEWRDKTWLPLSDKTGKDLIGLDLDEFTKTIIIPQDKFRAFIELGDAGRTELLSDLFGLHKFDLWDRANTQKKQADSELDKIEAELKGIGDVSAESLAKLKEEQHDMQQQLANHEVTLTELDEIKKLKDGIVETQMKLQADNEKIKNISTQLIDNQNFIENNKAQFDILKSQFDTRHNLRSEAQDLRDILKIQAWRERVTGINTRLSNAEKAIADEEDILKKCTTKRLEHETQYNTLAANRPDISLLTAVRAWYGHLDTIEVEYKRLETEQKEIENRIETGKTAAKTLFAHIKKALPNAPFLEKTSEAIVFLKNEMEAIKQRGKDLEEAYIKLKSSENLTEHLASLKEGEPCPLCGSAHHPSVFTPQSVAEELKKAAAQRQKLSDLNQTVNNIKIELDTLFKGAQDAFDNLKRHQDNLKINRDIFQKHAEMFIWQPAFSPTDISILKQKELEAAQFNERLDLAYKALKQAENEHNTQTAKLQNFKDIAQKITTEKQELETSIQVTLSNLSAVKNAEEWLMQPPLSIEQQIQIFDNQYITIENQFSALNTQMENAKQLASVALGQKQSLEAQNAALRQQLTNFEKALNEREYNPEKHEQLKTFVNTLRLSLGALGSQIANTETRLEKSKKLIEKQKLVQTRKQHLQILTGLFFGKGFTGYIANVFLKTIIEAANSWFARFTKNTLQLEVDDKNHLKIKDILNRGLTRNIETLSGGQKFQASLALALALSDSIQNRQQMGERFFFLDEGFGSLDRDSLRIVFDTLHVLREKGRVVGIISHIEEMQQEIGRYLQVSLDVTRGSIVELV
jgi:DNA repair protein SbcC/Rad50